MKVQNNSEGWWQIVCPSASWGKHINIEKHTGLTIDTIVGLTGNTAQAWSAIDVAIFNWNNDIKYTE